MIRVLSSTVESTVEALSELNEHVMKQGQTGCGQLAINPLSPLVLSPKGLTTTAKYPPIDSSLLLCPVILSY